MNNNNAVDATLEETRDLDVASILAEGFTGSPDDSANESSIDQSVRTISAVGTLLPSLTTTYQQGGEEHCPFAGASRPIPPTFPHKLMEMITWCHSDDAGRGKEAIHWCPNGTAFTIRHPENLTKFVLPKFFKTCKFESFKRKLYRYGFRQVSKGPDKNAYFQENFVRGLPELCNKLKIMYSDKEQTQHMTKLMENHRKKHIARAVSSLSKSASSLAPAVPFTGSVFVSALPFSFPQALVSINQTPSSCYPYPAHIVPLGQPTFFPYSESVKRLCGVPDSMRVHTHGLPTTGFLPVGQGPHPCFMVCNGVPMPSSESSFLMYPAFQYGGSTDAVPSGAGRG